MVKGKRITKKQLKGPDEFITLTERTFIFVQQHTKKIAAAGIILLVLIVAAVLFQMWEKKQEEEAARAFGVALEVSGRETTQGQEGSAGDYKTVLAKFDEIITKFPRTSSGNISLVFKGNILLKLEEYDEAIKAFTIFLDKAGKERLYQYFAWEGLGHAYEGKKDYGKALEAYKKILDSGEGYQISEAHLNIGYCYEKLGKNKEAIESFKAFLDSNQKSSLTNPILRKISFLERQ
ncbi:MAG TPA: tetratricopeptide repeat protein [Thermodesulfobacteriota bacterium]|nr:tetratricopeptide repeat protein [Thermodesulfobacteriota bacterium]